MTEGGNGMRKEKRDQKYQQNQDKVSGVTKSLWNLQFRRGDFVKAVLDEAERTNPAANEPAGDYAG